MSARVETETQSWNDVERVARENLGDELTAVELESLLRNIDHKYLVGPLRDAQAARTRSETPPQETGRERRAALALQERWNSWLAQRDVLREEIRRGKECLQQVRDDLAATRAGLEDWPAYERQCGKNPLFQYTESLSARERVEQFLPEWLRRREEQLQALAQEMEACARQNGMDHLL
jgi:hypothetical protein